MSTERWRVNASLPQTIDCDARWTCKARYAGTQSEDVCRTPSEVPPGNSWPTAYIHK